MPLSLVHAHLDSNNFSCVSILKSSSSSEEEKEEDELDEELVLISESDLACVIVVFNKSLE